MKESMEKMNIVLCLNSGYVMPSSVCILSVLQNNKCDINFYVIHSGLSSSEINFLNKVIKDENPKSSLFPICVGETAFDNSPTFGRSKEAFYRLLIPDLLPKEVKRCLYLDGDVLVTKDITNFYFEPFEGKAMIVSEDIGEILFFSKEQHSKLGIPLEYKYFNSGVLILNLEYFRESLNTLNFVNFINSQENLKFLDQDVLNGTCFDKVKYTNSAKYNLPEILINPIVTNQAIDKASIIHFLQKPWRVTYRGVNRGLWWTYGKQLYKIQYLRFIILNTIYQKALAFILLFVSISFVKRIFSFFRK
jgi:lipopolysaccharide biosynthesis glycosyltransferase